MLEMAAAPDGGVDNLPDVVPFLGGHGGTGSITWTAALPLIAGWLYDYYDDDAIVAASYDAVKAHVDYMTSTTPDGGAPGSCPTGSDWGDWCPPGFEGPDVTVSCGGKDGAHVMCFHYLEVRLEASFVRRQRCEPPQQKALTERERSWREGPTAALLRRARLISEQKDHRDIASSRTKPTPRRAAQPSPLRVPSPCALSRRGRARSASRATRRRTRRSPTRSQPTTRTRTRTAR